MDGQSATQTFPHPPLSAGVTALLTFDATPLSEYLAHMAATLTRHNKQIQTLTDEVRTVRSQFVAYQSKADEEITRAHKMLSAHDQAIRVFQQQVGLTVTNAQFNATILSVKDQIKTLDLQMAKLDPNAGRKSQDVMERAVGDFVKHYHTTVLLKEAEGRHARTQEHMRLLVERESEKLAERMDKDLMAPVQKQLATKATLDDVRKLHESIKDASRHSQEKMQELLAGQEQTIEAAKSHMATSHRELLGQVDDLAARVRPLIGHGATPPPGVTAPPRAPARPTLERAVPVPPPPTNVTSPPQPAPGLPLAGSLIGAVDAPAAVNHDAYAMHIIQSPTFLSFRQQVIEDIKQRVGTAQTAQLTEVESELVDIRAELKQRVTSNRVIELIKQNKDAETPARVSDLARRVDAVDADKVSQAVFTEALRGKGDLVTVQGKAEKTTVEELHTALTARLNSVDAAMDRILAERAELQDVLRDVLYTHRRAQVLREQQEKSAGGAAAGGGAGVWNTAAGYRVGGVPKAGTLAGGNSPPSPSAFGSHPGGGGPLDDDGGATGGMLPAIGGAVDPRIVSGGAASRGADSRAGTKPPATARANQPTPPGLARSLTRSPASSTRAACAATEPPLPAATAQPPPPQGDDDVDRLIRSTSTNNASGIALGHRELTARKVPKVFE